MPNYSSQLGAVKPGTRAVALEVCAAVEATGLGTIPQLWGYNPASKPEHSAGTAVDFMCKRSQGDFIADYLWSNRARLGVRWIIWRQRIRSTSRDKAGTWRKMADRGNSTANHMDHVHVNLTGAMPGPKVNAKPAPPKTYPRGLVSLSAVVAAAKSDGPRPQGGTTPGSADDVLKVEKALADRGYLDKALVDGSFGTSTVAAYAKFQRSQGYTGKDADGIPGKASLQALGFGVNR